MDIIRLYQDYGVEHRTEGHKHCRPGWVNVECPFCTGNPGLHLGWNLNEEYFFCWRCGWKSTIYAVSHLIGVSNYNEVRNILLKYGINRTIVQQIKKQKSEFKLPSNHTCLEHNHCLYLEKRGFDAEQIEDTWKIMGTGPISLLGKLNYKFRIIIPYFWNGEMVSFDARDITGKMPNKYMACPEEYEIIPRKSILYGNQEMWNPELGICVEGPTDVWRLGEMAFAVSGIQYTHQQVRTMANIFKKIAVVFDDEPQAQVQAKKLVAELRFRGVNAGVVEVSGDPGSLTDKQAKELIEIIKKQVK